ncbi:hypothetical protein M877_08600 [Streptomyces niveus NCIMB 11891]|nr:hypothetical protein M877_08600 [Streptomyces niveus NCIMB 11891]
MGISVVRMRPTWSSGLLCRLLSRGMRAPSRAGRVQKYTWFSEAEEEGELFALPHVVKGQQDALALLQ